VTTSSTRRRRAKRGSGEQLRAEIVAAAKELLASSDDASGVSIRSVADAVGVTSPSIYLHFADKEALLDAVVTDVFAELDQAMVSAAAGLELPLERLCAFGMAYVRFAVAHPAHYRLATMDHFALPPESDKTLVDSAFQHLSQTVAECMQAGVFATGDPAPVAFEMWAAAHGIAALVIAKPYAPWGDVDDFAYRVLRSAALGRATADLIGNPDAAEFTAWLARRRRSR
jgi:AcrR family transcriptional regulator